MARAMLIYNDAKWIHDIRFKQHTNLRPFLLPYLWLSLCQKGSYKYVEFFIKKRVDINFTDAFSQTGLMLAAVAGHQTVVNLLMVQEVR